MLEKILAFAFCAFFRTLTSACVIWRGTAPDARPRVYYANHSSHGDFLLIWSALPADIRARTRPIAGSDYWLTGAFRRYVIQKVFRGVTINRRVQRGDNPVGAMLAPLEQGDSLILFPEGTRNQGDGLLPFKTGIHHLAQARQATEFIPVWIENLGRALPKGGLIPIPLLCSLTFGAPVVIHPDETRAAFLARCRDALLSLAPPA